MQQQTTTEQLTNSSAAHNVGFTDDPGTSGAITGWLFVVMQGLAVRWVDDHR